MAYAILAANPNENTSNLDIHYFLQLVWKVIGSDTANEKCWVMGHSARNTPTNQTIPSPKEYTPKFSARDCRNEASHHWYSWDGDVNHVVDCCCDSTPPSRAPLCKCYARICPCAGESLTNRFWPCYHFTFPLLQAMGTLVLLGFLIWTTTKFLLFPLLQLQ